MAERMYPTSKPLGTNQVANGSATGPVFPATKSQLYGSSLPTYRPQAPKQQRRRSRRGCCCRCCMWVTIVILALILLAAIAGGVFYLIYRPRRPSFSVSTLQLSALNVTAANALNSKLDIAVTAVNPNKKLIFVYDPISIAASTGVVAIGDGSFPGFVHEAQNTTVLKATVASTGEKLDSTAAADLRKKSTIPLQIELETRAGAKVGSVKTKKMKVRVSCSGANVAVPTGKKTPSAAASLDISCKVKLRIKIWKWYL